MLNCDILVTVVTPSLNGGKYIEECINSIECQTYQNIEHIIVDGGSEDDTLAIIEKHPRVKLILGNDAGMYEAINKGLKVAKGDIVAYLNTDDIYHVETISCIVKHFMLNPETMMVYGDIDYVDANSFLINSYRYPSFNWYGYVAHSDSYIPQPTAFWRKSVHQGIGYFDENFKMAGDKDFFIRVGKSFRIDKLSMVLALMRIHKDTLTQNDKENSAGLNLPNVNKLESKIICKKYKVGHSKLFWLYHGFVFWAYVKTLNWKVYTRRIFSMAKLTSPR